MSHPPDAFISILFIPSYKSFWNRYSRGKTPSWIANDSLSRLSGGANCRCYSALAKFQIVTIWSKWLWATISALLSENSTLIELTLKQSLVLLKRRCVNSLVVRNRKKRWNKRVLIGKTIAIEKIRLGLHFERGSGRDQESSEEKPERERKWRENPGW